ncbi:MAG: hypothetical protein MUP82_07630, partial [Candidatus Marinimicrobia bacterium]|nr:hypothetical protein [Candidatus Neomarinimicrobiota bacterium]
NVLSPEKCELSDSAVRSFVMLIPWLLSFSKLINSTPNPFQSIDFANKNQSSVLISLMNFDS